MDRQITTGELKDKSLFQDSDGSAVPAKSMCHNCSKLKIFLGALAFSFFAKGFSGSYMKSMTSQIERRFEISSSIVGIIDGSFEIGNLMVMVLVSYLGPRVHRPKVIAIGCLIMSLGAFLSVIPQFLMGRVSSVMCFFPVEYISDMVYAYFILNYADILETYNTETVENSLFFKHFCSHWQDYSNLLSCLDANATPSNDDSEKAETMVRTYKQ